MQTISRAAGARLFHEHQSGIHAARGATGLSVVLRSTVTTARRHESTFQQAKVHEIALRPYPTACALHEALSMASDLLPEDRQMLVRALVRRQHGGAHPLWQALLLRAFGPMLQRLRKRDRGSWEDRDQRVLHAFLQAVASLSPSCGPVFVALARATARELFGAVRQEAPGAEHEPFDEDATASAPSPHRDAQPFVACLAREIAERLAERGGGEDLARVLTGVETLQQQAVRRAVRPSTHRQRSQRALCAVRRELARR